MNLNLRMKHLFRPLIIWSTHTGDQTRFELFLTLLQPLFFG
jgi:hypothetical protein